MCAVGQAKIQNFGSPSTVTSLGPFVDAFPHVQGLTHKLSVMRNLHRYNHDVNVGRSDELSCTLEGPGQTKSCSESFDKTCELKRIVRKQDFVRNCGCKSQKTSWFGRGGGDRIITY